MVSEGGVVSVDVEEMLKTVVVLDDEDVLSEQVLEVSAKLE